MGKSKVQKNAEDKFVIANNQTVETTKTTCLDEANFLGIATEALSATHKSILPDQPMGISAHTTEKRIEQKELMKFNFLKGQWYYDTELITIHPYKIMICFIRIRC